MPSNKELKKQAGELAEQLGVLVDTGGLKNDELAALVSDLKAKLRDAENVTQADRGRPGPTGADQADQADQTDQTDRFYMAKGKALICKRGILADGDEVKAEYLPGGEATLEKFVKSGHIIPARA